MKEPYIWQVIFSLRAGTVGHIITADVDVWCDQYAPLCGAHLKGPMQLHHFLSPDCKRCLRRLHEMESHDPGHTRREDPSHNAGPRVRRKLERAMDLAPGTLAEAQAQTSMSLNGGKDLVGKGKHDSR